MVLSIWRYSHLTLALSSIGFLLMLSVTGGVLALEPMLENSQSHDYTIDNTLPLKNLIDSLNLRYKDVYTLEKDAYDRISVSAETYQGTAHDMYVNPVNGSEIAPVKTRKSLFVFAKNLHRSLFLKSVGRITVGIVSFILFLIGISGFILLIRRQKKWFHFFTPIVNDGSFSYYHSYLGRWILVPILLISLSGVYLSLEKFALLPSFTSRTLEQDFSEIPSEILFQDILLSDVKRVEFPFTKEEDDYYIVSLYDRVVYLNQKTGKVQQHTERNSYGKAYDASFYLHTAEGNSLWASVLLVACLSILYFMYSGVRIFIERKKKTETFKNKYSKQNSEIIVLVGSETGSTFNFAISLINALSTKGKKVYLDTLNNFTAFENMQLLIVMTATYGDGVAPFNAIQFLNKLKEYPLGKNTQYSVVGFGSQRYPNYCKHADDIDLELAQISNFKQLVPIHRINEQSHKMFDDWCFELSNAMGLKFKVESIATAKTIQFRVISKTEVNIDNTYIIRLAPVKKTVFYSGNLLGVTVPGMPISARYYSIAKIGNEIHLSIKRHQFGVCSNYILDLPLDALLEGNISWDNDFRFPKKSKKVLLIANGTGVAPFLGMLEEIRKGQEVQLLLGLRNKVSSDLYEPYIQKALLNGALDSVDLAYSQQENRYVQSLVKKETEAIYSLLERKGSILICGSIKMKDAVLEVLNTYAESTSKRGVEFFIKTQQVKTDCY